MALLYGLIGFPLEHSFSREYFTRKFQEEGLDDHAYVNFPIGDISLLPDLIRTTPDLRGLNVTIPYKKTVLPFLSELSDEAREIGAVNTIVVRGEDLIGHNTDWAGFHEALLPLIADRVPERALILGTGGSARAVGFALDRLEIPFMFVSRQGGEGVLSYQTVTAHHIATSTLLVNATPLGMYPHINVHPDIDLEAITPRHLVFDLIYNPLETLLLRRAREQGATVSNGLAMLHLQAEAAWHIWESARMSAE